METGKERGGRIIMWTPLFNDKIYSMGDAQKGVGGRVNVIIDPIDPKFEMPVLLHRLVTMFKPNYQLFAFFFTHLYLPYFPINFKL
ncbi:MAG: hypothetical protein WAV32_02525 [Halobacteriota archaeon]